MNLVAKEGPMVNERHGVSILSENTGAHEELGEYALSVNPFDRAGLTEYEVTVPVTAGVTGVMACPMLNVCGDA